MISVASLGVSSFAVVTGSTAADTFFVGVGKVLDGGGGLQGSGVALSPRKVLTVGHIQASTTSKYVDNLGISHTISSISAAPNYSYSYSNSMGQLVNATTHTDLVLLTLGSDLPAGNYADVASTAKAGSFSMVGYGQGGTANGTGTGYTLNGNAGTRRAGTNSIDFGATYSSSGAGGGPNLFSFLDTAGEAALGQRDSGGGWFQNGDLVGINALTFNFSDDDGISTTPPKYANYGFGNANIAGYTFFDGSSRPAGSAYFASSAINVTDPQIQSWLIGQGIAPVPEPASVAALGFGALAMLRRRKRS